MRVQLDDHLAYQVAQGMPEDEALFHQAVEALEGSGRELLALGCVAELARRANPTMSITVTVMPSA